LSINGVLNILGQESVNEEWVKKRYVTNDYLTVDVIRQGSLKIRYARYKCLCCEHAEKLEVTKEEHLDVKVCPKYKGAFVNLFVYGPHK